MSDDGDPDRVDIVERTVAHDGFFRLETYALSHRKFDGGRTPVLRRELLERGRTAVVLPYDPVEDAVVLVEQFRIGAYAGGWEPWLIEAVAGTMEADEAPEDVVRREAREEADCRITELEPIGTFLLSPGACSEACAMFLGRTDSRGLGGIHGLAEEGEDIRVLVMPATEAIVGVGDGRITSAYGAIPLLWLATNREAIRARWR